MIPHERHLEGRSHYFAPNADTFLEPEPIKECCGVKIDADCEVDCGWNDPCKICGETVKCRCEQPLSNNESHVRRSLEPLDITAEPIEEPQYICDRCTWAGPVQSLWINDGLGRCPQCFWAIIRKEK